MHIGLVSPAWPVDELPNGISTYVHNLRIELMAQGHKVSVFCNLLGATNHDSDIHLVEPSLAYKMRRKLSGVEDAKSYNFLHWGTPLAAKINEVHQRHPLDVIEIDEFWGWCADVRARVHVPLVVKLHGPAFLDLVDDERQTDRARARIKLEGEGLRKMSAIIAPSRAALEDTLHHYNLTPRISEVVPNPVAFPAAEEAWELGACDLKTLVFVGRFDKRKGGDTVLLAFRQLLEQDPNVKLLFVGPDLGFMAGRGAPINFAEYAGSLFTSEQAGRITYVGKRSPAEIPGLRRRALVTLVASRWENQPNTVLEAMAQGCPVVAVDSGGVREIVQDGVTGLLARAGDIDDLCRKIMALLANPAKAQALGKHGRDFVARRHAVRGLAMDTINVYRQAISMEGEATHDAGKRPQPRLV